MCGCICFRCREIARGELARSRMEGFYADADTLPTAGHGRPDRHRRRAAQPTICATNLIGTALAHLIDWAEIGTISTLFSCLAAHAAVLHLRRYRRAAPGAEIVGRLCRPRARATIRLLAGLPARSTVPHSRRNDVAESELAAEGYRILSRLADGGVDMFRPRLPGRSLFCLLPRAIPNMAPTPWAANICAIWAASCAAKAPAPRRAGKLFRPRHRKRAGRAGSMPGGETDLAALYRLVTGAVPLQSWRGHTVGCSPTGWPASPPKRCAAAPASRPLATAPAAEPA